MTYRTSIVATMILSLLFGFEALGSGDQQKSEPESAGEKSKQNISNINDKDGKGHSTGNPNRRTWVVFHYSEFESQHIAVGDAFRIQKTGPNYKMKPLNLLRTRWNKDDSFVVDLVESGDDLLCGQVKLTGHEADQDHIVKFSVISADLLEVFIEVSDASKSLEKQCVPGSFIHGGRAHAEN